MEMSASTLIERSPQEVFAYVIEPSHDAEWRTGVVEAGMTSSGPMRLESTGFARAEARGKQLESHWRVTEFVEGALARWDLVSGPYKGAGGYLCEPADDGTQFTLESDVRPTGYLRLLGPLFGVLGMRQNRADVEKLKAILEAQGNATQG